jgi:hypothetical protein
LFIKRHLNEESVLVRIGKKSHNFNYVWVARSHKEGSFMQADPQAILTTDHSILFDGI